MGANLFNAGKKFPFVATMVPVFLVDSTDGLTPLTGRAYTDVGAHIRKRDDTSWTLLTLTAPDWTEVGAGLYLLKLTAAQLNQVGDFDYYVTSSGPPAAVQFTGHLELESPGANQETFIALVGAADDYSPVFRLTYANGEAALGVVFDDATVKYKDADAAVFSTLELTAGNWHDLGDGFYSVDFLASHIVNNGTFVFKASAPYTKESIGYTHVITHGPERISADIDFIRMNHSNRVEVDNTTKEETLFADDGTTPHLVFDLKNSAGVADGDTVYEKVPQTAYAP